MPTSTAAVAGHLSRSQSARWGHNGVVEPDGTLSALNQAFAMDAPMPP